MSDLHGLTGAYAVDGLDDVERVRFERHLAECEECRAEVASLREAVALLADDAATAPPPELRDRVLAQIATVRPLPPEVPRVVARPGAARRLLVGLVAAVVVAVAGVGVAVWRPWQEDTSVAPSAAERVLAAPDAASETLTFPGGARAKLVRSASLHQAVIVTTAMPLAPDSNVYQLWYQQPEDGMVSAGVMPKKADQTVLLEGDAATATAVGITVEPDGGSPEPTSDPIALFDFSQLKPVA
jgi:anti-sigma-K factor RskA